MRVFTLLTLCLLCVSSVHGKFGADSSVCDLGDYARRASKDPGPKKPYLPAQWNVRIEANILTQNYTQEIHESYDELHSRGAVMQYVGDVKTQMMFLHYTNEIITLQFDDSGNPPRCHVDDLDKIKAKNAFGLIQWKNGSDYIFSLNQASRFGGYIPEVYIGRAYARDGIYADAWESCNYLDSQDATFHLVWYFSSNASWTPAAGLGQVVPVQLSIDGIVHVNYTSSYPVNTQYAFTDFRPYTQPFETPPMTYCEHRRSHLSPPNISASFSFSAEVITPNTFFVDFIDEYYDKMNRLARIDLSVGESGHKKRLTRVLDYNTGIVYNLDSTSGTCAVSAMGDYSKFGDSSRFRMQTSAEFMDMNKMKRTYQGQRTVRGITCDVFAGRRSDYPPGSGKNSLWEWYYASREFETVNTGHRHWGDQLIMLQISSGSSTADLIYNVYDYYTDFDERWDIWKTDLTSCFNYTQRELVTLAFPGSDKDKVIDDVDGFKYAVLTGVSIEANIEPFRISELQVDLSGQNIDVSFYVLGSPILPVNVKVTSPVTSLADAVSKLRKTIHEGAFFVYLKFSATYAIKS